MRVQRRQHDGSIGFDLLDENNLPIADVGGFLRHLSARGCSPNTLCAYAHDLLHFYQFLDLAGLSPHGFGPPESLALLEHLRQVPSRRPTRRLDLVLATTSVDGGSTTRLAPATVNRIFAAISSFYEYLIVSGRLPTENPIQRRLDPALARVSERHRPFMGASSRQRPVRRVVRVKTVQRLPRPLDEDQVAALLGSLDRWRDRAMVLLMLHGGLRPGEVLSLHLDDVQYGRRRVIVRYHADHPKGARTKSRTERMVDLHEPATLEAVSAYVMNERPKDTHTSIVFLVGGHGVRRCEPLSYAALVRLFQRRCDALGIRQPWVTPHALRHTHATRMWEGGMRELSLQKRLGHASPESTRIYTRVSDAQVVADYRQALARSDP
jgi:integrase